MGDHGGWDNSNPSQIYKTCTMLFIPYYIILFLRMEHHSTPSLTEQLRNLSQLQNRIEETRKQLGNLSRIEHKEKGKLQVVYNQSMAASRNRLNLWQNHVRSNQRTEQREKQVEGQREKVRQMREQAHKELQEAKENLKRSKEEERLLIRERSVAHEQMIRRKKEAEMERKGNLVKGLKQERKQHWQNVAESRAQQCKRKEATKLNKTLAKISRTNVLERQLRLLTEEKQSLQERVEQQRAEKKRVQQETARLKKMKDQEVTEVVHKSRVVQNASEGPELNGVSSEGMLRLGFQQRLHCR